MATHNRGSVVLRTLERVDACGLPRDQYEIWVVDNASTDGTPDRIRRLRPDVRLIDLDRNLGSCAKAIALPHLSCEYVVFLDDDSYPLDETIQQMIVHFRADPRLGAAGFKVHLPGGGQECSALPDVFVGCGVGFRLEILREVGGLDVTYFMIAEEYDLAFRILNAGYTVKCCDDLHVLHLKTPLARHDKDRAYYDTRNNMMLAATYLPQPVLRELVSDWLLRYRALALLSDAELMFTCGMFLGLVRGFVRRIIHPDYRLDATVLADVLGWRDIEAALLQLKRSGYRKLLFADMGKNIYSFYRAARANGQEIMAIMDDRFAVLGWQYRNIPIVDHETGMSIEADAIVVSNSSRVHARDTTRRLQRSTHLPICAPVV